jgi:hypothetical protein
VYLKGTLGVLWCTLGVAKWVKNVKGYLRIERTGRSPRGYPTIRTAGTHDDPMMLPSSCHKGVKRCYAMGTHEGNRM